MIVQIEHIEGVRNLEAILSTEGVDGFLIGPYDLSASLGIPGEFENPLFKKASETAHRISSKIGALMGIHVVMPDTSTTKEKISEGYRFIAFGIDTLFLGESCRCSLRQINSQADRKDSGS